ncbi:hypothetical protein K435DRAFT_381922 [Dendrothele bispora CBS 962.96]|uniref:Uncharacterized protein n=1 Tax=Dendrothele bispora (strain CBS 962.96) TaxID=1314807 RepID=A0A4S8MWL1_DENBC|nr:hypothetical protein K435DRAFT_381922 [Dendrothele bispora CBS 962.96]
MRGLFTLDAPKFLPLNLDTTSTQLALHLPTLLYACLLVTCYSSKRDPTVPISIPSLPCGMPPQGATSRWASIGSAARKNVLRPYARLYAKKGITVSSE